MGLVGQGSNQDLAWSLREVERAIAGLPEGPVRPQPYRRTRKRRGETLATIHSVLATTGEMRMMDIHLAVEAVLEEPVSRSSVKNCLALHCEGPNPLFERIQRGRHKLA